MKRILVLDAEREMRSRVEERLREEGYLVETGEDGGEGLARIAAAPPDAIILDVPLQTVSGFEVLGRLKSSPATKEIPVFVFTNKVYGSDRNRVLELGAAWFQKPTDLESLLAALRRCG